MCLYEMMMPPIMAVGLGMPPSIWQLPPKYKKESLAFTGGGGRSKVKKDQRRACSLCGPGPEIKHREDAANFSSIPLSLPTPSLPLSISVSFCLRLFVSLCVSLSPTQNYRPPPPPPPDFLVVHLWLWT